MSVCILVYTYVCIIRVCVCCVCMCVYGRSAPGKGEVGQLRQLLSGYLYGVVVANACSVDIRTKLIELTNLIRVRRRRGQCMFCCY